MLEENIAAISTPSGAGGCAIIRISGENPITIAEKMFRPLSKIKPSEFEPYKLYVGEIDGGEFTDFGMCVIFKAPKSYTGENMVEFHCHGGVAITRGILKRAIELGCRLAERGEFTRRAFLNGKLSLSSAEGLIGMIESQTAGEVKAGYYLYRERLKKEIELKQEILTDVLAEINAGFDFPEEDLEMQALPDIKAKLTVALEQTCNLLKSYNTGRKVKNGVKVAIVGKPNAGKSSLLNAIIGQDKAIVSDIAGTTRDVVEGSCVINGVSFDFSDTAGIRESGDKVEMLGIDLAKRVLMDSDLVLFVLDGAKPIDDLDRMVASWVEDKEKITVYNKIDSYPPKVVTKDIDLNVSAVTGENVDKLKELLYERAIGKGFDLNADYLTEQRHYEALKNAELSLQKAITGLEQNLPFDLIAIDITEAWQFFGEISGKTTSEEIVSEIFARFCVGK